MHEFSIVSSLLESCEEIAREHGAKKVFVVCVEIGERSGVNARLLQSAFEEFKKGGICEEAVLKIQISRVKLFCRQCGMESVVEGLDYTHCPQCQSENVSISGGNEMLLLRLEME